MKKNEYKCEICHGVFKKGWSDEEAKAEHFERHPNIPLEETGLVCDPCFQKIMKDVKENPWRYPNS